MTAPMEGYDEVDAIESFDDLELAEEAILPFKLGRRVSVAGAGLSSATLHTPKGPAKLNLPSPVPTLVQFRTLETALNANTQRVNAVQAELVKVRRELALRRRDPQGQGMLSLLLPLMMKQKFDEHVHTALNAPPTIPTDSGGGFSSFLPLLLLQPGLLGQSAAGSPAAGGQDSMSQLILMLVIMEAL